MIEHDPNDPAALHALRHEIWQRKYAIRACYRGWFERMRPWIVPGRAVEVGSGSGGFGQEWDGLIRTDVVLTPHVDLVTDAMRLPFADGSIGNLVLVDLLHHLTDPHRLFDEATRVLRSGGRMLMIEPFITPLSYVAYKLLHHEPVWFRGYHPSSKTDDPWQGNLALANVVFSREAADWPRRHPSLQIIHRRRFSLLDFQLAGGFKRWSLMPGRRLYDLVLAIDRRLDWLAPLCGFRVFCVLEKRQ